MLLFQGPSFAYSLPVHSFHTRRDQVASLTTCRLHGAAIQRASPLGPGRALTLPCGWNNAGRRTVATALTPRATASCISQGCSGWENGRMGHLVLPILVWCAPSGTAHSVLAVCACVNV